jgi:GNAT superfamily N-acetyltransferase
MTFPRYRAWLMQEGNEHVRFLAWGAVVEGRPAALLFVEVGRKQKNANLLSIYTEPALRNQGLARGLLSMAEGHLREAACPLLLANYTTATKAYPIVEHLLGALGWEGPQGLHSVVYIPSTLETYAHYCQTLVGSLGYELPQAYAYRPWLDLRPEELAALKADIQAQGKVPMSENPFNSHDAPIDPSSAVLEHGGQIVGWMMNHRLAQDRLRFSILHLSDQYRGQKLGLKLVNETVRRAHLGYRPDESQMYLFQSRLDNAAMQAFIQGAMPSVSHIEEARQMKKALPV